MLSGDDTVRVINAAKTLNANPNIEEALKVVSRLDGLTEKVFNLEHIGHENCSELITNPKYYGTKDGPWGFHELSTYNSANTTAMLMCPAGKYLAGVRVYNDAGYIDRVYCCNLH